MNVIKSLAINYTIKFYVILMLSRQVFFQVCSDGVFVSTGTVDLKKNAIDCLLHLFFYLICQLFISLDIIFSSLLLSHRFTPPIITAPRQV